MSDWEQIGQRVVELTERLVRTLSVVDTDGEAAIARLLAQHLREGCAGLPHVELHEVAVPKQPPCNALLALCPASEPTARTLVLLGHFDTVGLEPYGPLAGIATDSAKLKQHFAAATDLAAAAASPDWAFGRGWHDMKGGVAATVETFLHEARSRELRANLVLALAPDEESASRGVRALIPELTTLCAERGWQIAYVVNADYTAPITPDDDNRYFYSGTVGKLLLGLSVFGKTTHVGETFHGVNASALAGYLAGALEHNRKLLVGTGGEWLPPPTVLRLADRRERYDVMTADSAELYVNVFHLGGDASRKWRALLQEVRRLVRLWDRQQRLQYNRFVRRANLELPRYTTRPEVIDYAELRSRADGVSPVGTPPTADAAGGVPTDDREVALARVRELHATLPPGRPLVVLSLLPPFYPAQLNPPDRPDTAALIDFARESGLKHRRVYPYIADLSYFAFSAKAVAGWEANAPLWFEAAELAALTAGSAPVCNLGPWGLGAHTERERVYLPYLRRLPELLSGALHRLAGQS